MLEYTLKSESKALFTKWLLCPHNMITIHVRAVTLMSLVRGCSSPAGMAGQVLF